jgi:phosphoserine phosphatase
MEKGEAAAQTAVREVLEETGYRTKALFVSPITVESHYFAEHKNEWRSRLDHPVLLELESNERGPVSAGELAKHESRWIKIEDALGMEMFKNNKLALELSLGRLSAYSEQRSTERPMLVNSGIYDGLSPEEAKTKMTDAFGRRKTTYKLRDWIVSRQRYWGVPIPIIHCPKCGAVPVPEKDLPVKLPEVTDYLPEGSGKSPLAKVKKWVETECPSCREKEKAPKYLIFDFDGVIGDTRKQNILARIAMGEAKNWKESEAMMLKYFSTKPWHSRGKHFTTAHKKRHKDWTYRYGVEVLKMKFKLFDGFVKEIRKLKNMKIAVVSAGHEMYSRGPLEKSGIRYTHFLAGNHDHSKETKIERVVRDWGVDLKDVYYFTDTTADVYELENLLDRKRIIGCSWGYVGEKVLREALPKEQILTAFSDIHRLWKPTMGERETDTLDTFVDSSWYYLRYTDPKNTKKFADMKKMDAWMPVDLYSGGAEHTTMHVLYSRFWQKALFDIGLVKNHEPYARRMNRSIILGPDGQKMSKSRGNVIDPDEVVKRLGTDTVRMYLAFIGPYNEVANYPWNPDGVVGVRRFLERVWRAQEIVEKKDAPALDPLLHKTIKKVGEDIPALKFNTAISQLMIFQNAVEKAGTIGKKQWNTLLKLLAPFAPHLAEELWHAGGGKKSVHLEKWPAHDLKLLVEESMTLAVQINGKTRGEVIVPSDATKETQEEAARTAVASRLAGKTVRRSVVVPGRLVNFVIS